MEWYVWVAIVAGITLLFDTTCVVLLFRAHWKYRDDRV